MQHPTISLCAAGSLRGALGEVIEAFTAQTGIEVTGEYGGSGVLRERIEQGEPFDVFASADMGHPQRLFEAGRAGGVKRFAGNRLCAITRPGQGLTPENFLETVLRPEIRLGTSTPGSDPSGDYTWKMFDAAGRLQSGADETLKAKALKLMGGPRKPGQGKPPENHGPKPEHGKGPHRGPGPIQHAFESGQVDVFILYRTAGRQAAKDGLVAVDLPPVLDQLADYGLTVLNPRKAEAEQFAAFLLGEEGQRIFARWGFETGTR